jgi:hypothetical protein
MRLFEKIVASVLVLAGSGQPGIAAEGAGGRPLLLESLDGRWTMVGDVMGKPVQYEMEAFPTLQGTFTEIHMNDVQVPSEYEARVFIGVDKSGEVIAHWLDSFGAKYSAPHGTGSVTDSTIVFYIPYPSGQFRDTLSYQPAAKTWTLVIEGAKPDGSWLHFAKYDIRRKPAER